MIYYTYLDSFYFSLIDDICFISIPWKLKNLLRLDYGGVGLIW